MNLTHLYLRPSRASKMHSNTSKVHLRVANVCPAREGLLFALPKALSSHRHRPKNDLLEIAGGASYHRDG
jgi:hypothetical protein